MKTEQLIGIGIGVGIACLPVLVLGFTKGDWLRGAFIGLNISTFFSIVASAIVFLIQARNIVASFRDRHNGGKNDL